MESYDFTPKEVSVIQLIVRDVSFKQMSAHMGIGVKAVRWHCTNIYRKIGVKNRIQAIIKIYNSAYLTTIATTPSQIQREAEYYGQPVPRQIKCPLVK